MKKTLELYYAKYLKEIRKLSDSSVNHYHDALRYISKLLVQRHLLNEDIYEISDYSKLVAIDEFLKEDAEFVAMDKRGHQMYSSGYKNYMRFAQGDEFGEVSAMSVNVDMIIPFDPQHQVLIKQWPRSEIVKRQSLKLANYLCELSTDHKTFEIKKENHQYMEGHHGIPLRKQELFKSSLDVYANIFCLCPLCHRFIHYAEVEERKPFIDKFYSERVERLASSGIVVSKNEFEELAL